MFLSVIAVVGILFNSSGLNVFAVSERVQQDGPRRAGAETLHAVQARLTSIVFNSDGRLLVTVQDTRIRVWNALTGELIHEIYHAAPHMDIRVQAVAFSPTGRHLVSAANDGRIVVWDVRNYEKVRVIQTPWFIDHTIGSLDAGTRVRESSMPQGELDLFFRCWTTRSSVGFSSISIASGGDIIAAGLYDGTVHTWELETGAYNREYGRSRATKERIQLKDIIPSEERRRVWARMCGQHNGLVEHIELWALPSERRQPTRVIGFHPEGKILLAHDGKVIRAWNRRTGDELYVIHQCGSFSLSEDGRLLVTYNLNQHTTDIYDAVTGNEVVSLGRGGSLRGPYAFFPHERALVAATATGSITIRDIETGDELAEFKARQPNTYLEDVTVSLDGKRVAGVWSDGRAHVWNISRLRTVESQRHSPDRPERDW